MEQEDPSDAANRQNSVFEVIQTLTSQVESRFCAWIYTMAQEDVSPLNQTPVTNNSSGTPEQEKQSALRSINFGFLHVTKKAKNLIQVRAEHQPRRSTKIFLQQPATQTTQWKLCSSKDMTVMVRELLI